MQRVEIFNLNAKIFPERFIKVTGTDEDKLKRYCFFLPLEYVDKFKDREFLPEDSMEVSSTKPFVFDEKWRNWKNQFGSRMRFKMHVGVDEPKEKTGKKFIKLKLVSIDNCPFCENEFNKENYKYDKKGKKHVIKCAECLAVFMFKSSKISGSSKILLNPISINRGKNPKRRNEIKNIEDELRFKGIEIKDMIKEPIYECTSCGKQFKYSGLREESFFNCDCGFPIEGEICVNL